MLYQLCLLEPELLNRFCKRHHNKFLTNHELHLYQVYEAQDYL